MTAATTIEWTDITWNPVTGCTKVSQGCKHCYAERLAPKVFAGQRVKVLAERDYPTFVEKKGDMIGMRDRRFTDVRCHPDRLDAPLRMRKPRRIFVNSMSDLFHEDVPDSFIAEVFGVMGVCGADEPRPIDPATAGRFGAKWDRKAMKWHDWKGPHTFQVLTKRPERMRALLTSPRFRSEIASAAYRWAHNQRDAGYLAHQIDRREEYARCYPPGRMWPLSNVWLGVSVEDQATADERIPPLLETPAAVRWISAEPLLGPLSVRRWLPAKIIGGPGEQTLYGLDWVVTGGESGPKARPMHPDWARSLRDQCAAAGVPFLFKQWGAWAPGECGPQPMTRAQPVASYWAGKWSYSRQTVAGGQNTHRDDEPDVYRFSKKAAGRTLDGRVHDEYPA